MTHFSVISSTSPSPPHYLHLTIFTSPSTASSNLKASPWTSLLHPSSLALPFSLFHQSSLSLPPASLTALQSPPRHSHLAISTLQSTPCHLHIALHLAKHPRLQRTSLKQEVVPINMLPSIASITFSYHLLWSLTFITCCNHCQP